MIDGIIATAHRFREALQAWREMNAEERSWYVAFVFVPAAVMSMTLTYLIGPGLLPGTTELISVIPLRSAVTERAQAPYDGVVVIVDAGASAVDLPVASSNPRLLTSMDPATAGANEKTVEPHNGGIRVSPPLLGNAAPLVIVAEGRPGDSLFVPGGAVARESLPLVPIQARSVPIVVVLCATFGLGLAAAAENRS